MTGDDALWRDVYLHIRNAASVFGRLSSLTPALRAFCRRLELAGHARFLERA